MAVAGLFAVLRCCVIRENVFSFVIIYFEPNGGFIRLMETGNREPITLNIRFIARCN